MTRTGRPGGRRGGEVIQARGWVGLQRDQVVVLVFEIERHRYGIETDAVHEIVRAVQPVRLPKAPAVVAGLINVRGEVVPLVDLRVRFGLPVRALHRDEVFLIVATHGRRFALRADSARELVRVPTASVVPAEQTLPRANYAAGTAILPDGLLLICDLHAFLEEGELIALDGAIAAQQEAAP